MVRPATGRFLVSPTKHPIATIAPNASWYAIPTTGHGWTIDPRFRGTSPFGPRWCDSGPDQQIRRSQMSFSDITLTCKDCGNPFVFTAGEQEFYQQRGLMNQPGRCSDCRAARKASGGGSASYGGGGSRGGYGGEREFFTATCSSC